MHTVPAIENSRSVFPKMAGSVYSNGFARSKSPEIYLNLSHVPNRSIVCVKIRVSVSSPRERCFVELCFAALFLFRGLFLFVFGLFFGCFWLWALFFLSWLPVFFSLFIFARYYSLCH